MTQIVPFRCLRRLAMLTVLAACITSLLPRTSSADSLQEDSSLKFAPADVSFYVAGMRMREVFDTVASSNAIAKLKSNPTVQLGLGLAMAQWQNPQDPQIAMFKQMLADPANQRLVSLLKDAVSHEIFMYGDQSFGDAIALLNDVNAANTAGQMEALAAGDFVNMQAYQARKMAEVLEQRGDELKIPSILTGMKLSDGQAALDQLNRLETLVQAMLQQQPALLERFSREQIGGGEFLTIKLDGTLIPGQTMQGDLNIDQPQALIQMPKLREKINSLTLVISIGVRDDYLLISMGADNAHLSALGQGDLLVDREEMAPVRDASDKPINEIAYVSREFMKHAATIDGQMDQLVMMAKQFAPMIPGATPELQQELNADMEKLADYAKQNMPEPASLSAFSHLTPEGFESFVYNWSSTSELDASQNLPILNHVGGNPIAFIASCAKYNPQQYDNLETLIARLAYYGEKIVGQQLDQTRAAQYEQLKADFLPLLKRLSATTREKLVPAFRDGQSALVVDFKSTSDAWHEFMPPTEDELPMLELGIVMGVSDVNLAKEGFAEYFNIAQEAIDKLHEASTGDLSGLFPNPVPPIKLAKPQAEEVSGGTVYYYALPAESGLDTQLAPNAGLSEKVLVASLLPRFTARLLSNTPVAGEGPLADTNRPLASAFHLDFAGLLDAVTPWIDYGVDISMAMSAAAQFEQNPMANLSQQVHDVMDVLKCFRGVSGVTYQKDDAIVTHFQWRFEDVQ